MEESKRAPESENPYDFFLSEHEEQSGPESPAARESMFVFVPHEADRDLPHRDTDDDPQRMAPPLPASPGTGLGHEVWAHLARALETDRWLNGLRAIGAEALVVVTAAVAFVIVVALSGRPEKGPTGTTAAVSSSAPFDAIAPDAGQTPTRSADIRLPAAARADRRETAPQRRTTMKAASPKTGRPGAQATVRELRTATTRTVRRPEDSRARVIETPPAAPPVRGAEVAALRSASLRTPVGAPLATVQRPLVGLLTAPIAPASTSSAASDAALRAAEPAGREEVRTLEAALPARGLTEPPARGVLPVAAPAASTAAASRPARPRSSAVQQVVNRYRDAFNALDPDAAHAVWPSVDTKALGRAFDRLAEQNVALEPCSISVVGARAVASCDGTLTYVPKIGSRNAHVERRQWRFNLRETGDQWSIDSVATR